MLAPDTMLSLYCAVDLINTRPNVAGVPADRMSTKDDMLAFVTRVGYAADWYGGRMALEPLRESRRRIHEFWTSDSPFDAARQVNEMLNAHNAVAQLVNHEPYGWHLHPLPVDANLEDWVVVDAAEAVSAAIRAGEFSRLGRCAAPECEGVFIDSTRNLTQRYCVAGSCADRVRAAEFRARRRKQS